MRDPLENCRRVVDLFRQATQRIAGATPTGFHFAQHTARQKIIDVTQRRIRRTFGDRRPLAAGELAVESIQQPLEQFHLTFVERYGGPSMPEARLDQHGIERVLRLIDSALKRREEPGQPVGDIKR